MYSDAIIQTMKFVWDEKKNYLLKRIRNISFERVLTAIEHGGLVDILEHNHPIKYPEQKLMVVNIDNYCWVIPFKDDETQGVRKLITAFPSRTLTKRYLR